jgi:hypothetical protein
MTNSQKATPQEVRHYKKTARCKAENLIPVAFVETDKP